MNEIEENVELSIKISEIAELINQYDIEIKSPDGFVPVSEYVNKGQWDEYIIEDITGNRVSVNENHLFETITGWVLSKNLRTGDLLLKEDNQYHPIKVIKTGKKIPIVDVVINHENHRYYANGFSSHNTNVGKTLGMIHFASSYLMQGKNVLYITLEMSEEAISNRIDANLMDMEVNDVETISLNIFNKKINALRNTTTGELVVKEYPTSSAHVGHFKILLQELAMKKNFKPDVILVDYIGIMASSRVSMNTTGSYGYVKAIAEELRALGVEYEVPVWSAVQANRSGYSNTDVDLTNTAESFGLPATADFMFAFIRTDELDALNQLLVKQLKSRYGNKNYFEKFVIGVDAPKMQLYDVEYSAQENLLQSDGTLNKDEDDESFGYRKPNEPKKIDGLIV